MPALLPGLVPLPDLDDRTWADLVEEARGLLPGLDPGWTDHGPTDPGMVLVELFAWLTEMLIYRVDRVPEASLRKFVKLLTGVEPAPADDLEEAVAQALAQLRERYRAVTAADYERLALEAWPSTPEASVLGPSLAPRRALALPRIDLGGGSQTAPAAGWISLVVIPSAATPLGAQPPASRLQPLDGAGLANILQALLAGLQAWIDGRRLAGTQVRVVGPQYVEVGVSARLTLREDADPATVFTAASTALLTWFDPLAGGPDGGGWPFGRDVSHSDVLRVLRSLADVDSVPEIKITLAGGGAGPAPDLVALEPHQLPWLGKADLQQTTGGGPP